MSTPPRQRPGAACDDCRRKKLRCDRLRPCGACDDVGLSCSFTDERQSRGPKKGHLKDMRERLAALEKLISNPTERPVGGLLGQNRGVTSTVETSSSASSVDRDDSDSNEGPGHIHVLSASTMIGGERIEASQWRLSTTPAALGATSPEISTMVRDDLDQLYFDRMHLFVPILHSFRYHSWARQSSCSPARTCLRHAVWTIAAGLSTQFQSIKDGLYRDTRQMLAALEMGCLGDSLDRYKSSLGPNSFGPVSLCHLGDEAAMLEQAQAWILVSIYELTQLSQKQAYISAGRAIRLVQLLRLNEIDAYAMSHGTLDTPIEIEEKRRTFWMAYCLDRILAVPRNNVLALSEQVVLPRLPLSDGEFQSGTLRDMPFLLEAMASDISATACPFTELIILSTQWGRILTHQQQASSEQRMHLDGDTSADSSFWERHLWLETLVLQRMELQGQSYHAAPRTVGPRPLLMNMMAQASLLLLCKAAEAAAWQLGHQQDMLRQCQQRAYLAAKELTTLARSLPQINFLRIHPFTSIPLIICGEFLTSHRGLKSVDASIEESYGHLSNVLEELATLNMFTEGRLMLFALNTYGDVLDCIVDDDMGTIMD